ncbi:hypothetical protein [Mycobacterium stomatepiae]|uniref:hypothetical protein n=1 Tax=Mycobacterium stomatepiae TaxID=470076 RepID=UPI0013CFC12A|nr:hypothetical protein [Mycobacterium stomatepiae]MCV7167545.1 hypothetical protein [Mycobacterium stomatepiae]
MAAGATLPGPERRDGRPGIIDRVCVAEWIAGSTNGSGEEVLALLTGVRSAAHDRIDPSCDRPPSATWAGANS